MYFEVTCDGLKWQKYLAGFSDSRKDIYFDYRYAAAYEKNGDGRAACAIFKGENGMRVLYPFLVTRIPDYNFGTDYYDLTGCYGYGGPVTEDYNGEDMDAFEKELHKWCIENNIIAEFIRFHPLLDNHNKFRRSLVVEKNRRTVCIDLTSSFEEIWTNSLTGKNRNHIRKAEKSGVIVKESTDISTFIDIYKQTMEGLGADGYYYFSDGYFNELVRLIPENMVILEAVYGDKVIAASMFMFMGDKMHYHLSGSIKEYNKLCPVNLILSSAIKYGMSIGMRQLHLGGGLSDSEEDSLFKFKNSFSPDIKEFYIGKRVHNEEIYHTLIKKWEEKHNKQAGLFLQYEMP